MDWTSAAKSASPVRRRRASEYAEATAGTSPGRPVLANQLIGSGGANVVAVAVGNDVAVYADSADDNGVADDMVVLAGPHAGRRQLRELQPGGAYPPPV